MSREPVALPNTTLSPEHAGRTPVEIIRRDRWTWTTVLLSFMAIVVLRNAWVTEDAYIMFRTIDNFVNGLGLVWNPGERVQTFTNPLWTLLLSGVFLITEDLFYTSIFMGALCSLGAAYIMGRHIAATVPAMIVAWVPLVFSKAFIDYSTSGLENPFTFLALAVFYAIFFRQGPVIPRKQLLQLSLVLAMAMLNRMDTLLLFFPAYAYEFFRLRGWRYLGTIALGFLPFIVWEIFSVIYYGFPFPNTAYAKLSTGISVEERMEQGWHYLINSLAWDPITLFGILTGVIVIFCRGGWRGATLALGILLYVYYTVRVGGDFMSGRFFAAPFFLSMVGLAACTPAWVERSHAFAFILLVGLFGISNKRSPVTSDESYHYEYEYAIDQNGIADERGYYFQATGMLNSRTGRFPLYFWRNMGEEAAANVEHERVMVFGNIGILGYYAGPEVHIVDDFALADPLLARLHAVEDSRVGHFKRELPSGYLNSHRSGQNLIWHPDLSRYYDALSLVVSGPIFSAERFTEIFRLNTGHYDHLLRSYRETRHLVLKPLDDLLEVEVHMHHAIGWWGPRGDGYIWGIGWDNHLLIHTLAETPGTLRFTMDCPMENQQVEVFLNDVSLKHFHLPPGDTVRVELPIVLEENRQNWLTFRYRVWNDDAATLVPGVAEPVSVRFHELGIQ